MTGKFYKEVFIFFSCITYSLIIKAQPDSNKLWHGIEREIHYMPDGDDFVLMNGKRRFNRALYGSNTAFRAEAGDLPEFALYLPGMGGNLKFGLASNDSSKWIIDAQKIQARYRPGSMIYTIHDPLLQNGTVTITVMALYDREALMVKMEHKNIPASSKLIVAFGGATGTRFSREGDIGADPESSFYLKPEYCRNNIYAIDKNKFTLFFGSNTLSEEERYQIQHRSNRDPITLSATIKSISGIFPPSAILKLSDANKQLTPLELHLSKDTVTPVATAQINFDTSPLYFFIQNGNVDKALLYDSLTALFASSEAERKELAAWIQIKTPDQYINPLGGALSVAADAVWEDPSFLHGAWRCPRV